MKQTPHPHVTALLQGMAALKTRPIESQPAAERGALPAAAGS